MGGGGWGGGGGCELSPMDCVQNKECHGTMEDF